MLHWATILSWQFCWQPELNDNPVSPHLSVLTFSLKIIFIWYLIQSHLWRECGEYITIMWKLSFFWSHIKFSQLVKQYVGRYQVLRIKMLIKIVYFCFSFTENERALDPEEKPHQFTEHNSPKPLIFLRMKVSLLITQLHRSQYIVNCVIHNYSLLSLKAFSTRYISMYCIIM